jgi:hypothetical protein
VREKNKEDGTEDEGRKKGKTRRIKKKIKNRKRKVGKMEILNISISE